MHDDMDRILQSAREDYDRARRAKERLDALIPEWEPMRVQIEALKIQCQKEEKDVARMESGSLTAFFLALFDKEEKRLTREREEALEAAVRYDAACAKLALLRQEIDRLTPEAAALPALRVHLETLLAEKKQRLAHVPQVAERMADLEEQVNACKRHQREVREAIRAARRALNTAKDAEHELQEAEKLGYWDLFGGGMLMDYAKHEHMDAAQEAVNRLQGELRLLRSELADVHLTADVHIKADSFDRFADIFWDTIFTDYSMLERISSARTSVSNVYGSLEQTLSHLESMQKRTEAELNNAEENLRRFIEAQHSA